MPPISSQPPERDRITSTKTRSHQQSRIHKQIRAADRSQPPKRDKPTA
ncbi:hypothetical protein [Oscillatoria sp. HE19RPO]|nr:hypothetical protein [Oscillatoria sp. HE19RPO]